MKRTLYTLLLLMVLPIGSMAAGRIAEIWTQPAVFKADEQVSFFFDLTGTDLQDETEGVYMWSWFPSEPDAGHWSNPSSFAKLVHVEGSIWRLDLVPTVYYNKPANEISAFYGLLKNKDGSKVTDAFAPDAVPANAITVYDLSTIKKSENIIDYYPKQFTKKRPLSILINANNTWSNCETTGKQGELAKAPEVRMHGGVNNWAVQVQNSPENLSKTTLTHLGDGIYRKDIILNDYFGLTEDFKLININLVFANSSWAFQGKDVNCGDFVIVAPEIAAEPIPELILFPQKISKKDIFCIIRKTNESYVSKLNYTITAGSKTLTGAFEGTKAEMSAYIDLATNLKDESGLTKLHLVITDNTGRKIADTDIPLVQLTK
jgi:hypothetical protein